MADLDSPETRRDGDGSVIRTVVKWFNADKGFGFVAPVDGSSDVFLHMSALKRAGFTGASEGATLLCEVRQGMKGREVARVLEMDDSTANPQPRRAAGGARDQETVPMEGTVKWFNPEKGFGFISPRDGGKDVFIHIAALRRSGLDRLDPGQEVHMQIAQGMKGPEAVSLRLA